MSSGDIGSSDDHLKQLDLNLAKASLKGAWEHGPRQPGIKPWLWRWEEIFPCLLEAGELVPINDSMRMRTVGLVNRSRPVPQSTSRTLAVSMQHLGPGETTESHRHTRTSLYFMIQGTDTYTIAEGEQQLMEPGDLLVQPSWTWHGTMNKGREAAVWVTVQDTGLINTLDAEFREQYPGGRLEPATKPDGFYLGRLGAVRPNLFTGGEGPRPGSRFPVKYKWADTLSTLEGLAAAGEKCAQGGMFLEYVEPLTGGPTTRTMACQIQMLRPGEETRPYRQLSNTIYTVVVGHGVSQVGSERAAMERLEWGDHDCFHIPPWQWHFHRNTSADQAAILFSVNDRPLTELTGLYRQELG